MAANGIMEESGWEGPAMALCLIGLPVIALLEYASTEKNSSRIIQQ
ncbi:hypothetical protein [Lacrimispora sphenoides]|nr:hypothetical protein [Lacrimispora sphenoides]